MTHDDVVEEAMAAFARDLDYATALVALHVGSPPPPPPPERVCWGAPPRFVSDNEVPYPGLGDLSEVG